MSFNSISSGIIHWVQICVHTRQVDFLQFQQSNPSWCFCFLSSLLLQNTSLNFLCSVSVASVLPCLYEIPDICISSTCLTLFIAYSLVVLLFMLMFLSISSCGVIFFCDVLLAISSHQRSIVFHNNAIFLRVTY